ncbi:MAG TPA: tetratricopeptide repeat protein, partial [Candidatus Limnocylindrales bacterium]|nr:tetratricopeptide repeat protein [Candidatus Limnocylindrales bacterium]
MTLGNIADDDPTTIYESARNAFGRWLGHDASDDDTGRRWAIRSRAGWRMLDIHSAALASVLGPVYGGNVLDGPLEQVLFHERDYWQRALAVQALAHFPPVSRLSDRVLAVPTLFPVKTLEHAASLLSLVPGDGERLPGVAEDLARVIAMLYPGTDELFWSPLVPDRLGETLVGDVLMAAPSEKWAADELGRLLSSADLSAALQSVTVLARTAGFVDGVQSAKNVARRALAVIERLVVLQARTFLPAVVSVAAAASRPEGLLKLVSRHVSSVDADTIEAAAQRLPEFHADLLDLSVEIEEIRVEALRARCEQDHSIQDDELKLRHAAALNSLAVRYADVLSPYKALVSAKSAVEILDSLITSNRSRSQPHDDAAGSLLLARSMNNLGLRLANVGRVDEALSILTNAVDVCRDEARRRPDLWLPELVMSLNNLGGLLSVHRSSPEALWAVGEAAEVCCGLAMANATLWLKDLVTLLINLGSLLDEAGMHDEGVSVASWAVTISREAEQVNPSLWAPRLAMALNCLSGRLSVLGRIGLAVKAAEESVAIRRRLVRANPSVWRGDLALSLSNLSGYLCAAERFDPAYRAAIESVVLRRNLLTDGDDATTKDLSSSLANLSNSLTRLGRTAEATGAAEEAVELLRGLYRTAPGSVAKELAMALCVLSQRLADSGKLR